MKFKNVYILLAVVEMIFSIEHGVASSPSSSETIFLVNTPRGLNVRRRPTKFGKWITALPMNTPVRVIKSRGRWAQVIQVPGTHCSVTYPCYLSTHYLRSVNASDAVRISDEINNLNDHTPTPECTNIGGQEGHDDFPIQPPNQITPKPTPPAPIPPAQKTFSQSPTPTRWDMSSWKPSWSAALGQALRTHGQNLLHSKIRSIQAYCPNFNSIDAKKMSDDEKIQFYTAFFEKLSFYESSHNPAVSNNDRISSNHVVSSRGMLGISIDSSRIYKCNLSNAHELFSAEKNLACGVKILDTLVGQDQIIAGLGGGKWMGGARYWGPLRKPSKVQEIQNFTRKVPACIR